MACVILVAMLLLLIGQESMATVGARFMSALARGDAQTLAANSYVEGKTSDELLKEWQHTVDVTKHVRFRWNMLGSDQTGPETGSVRLEVERNMQGYGDKFQLPLRRVGDKWKVEVRGISREMYPFLPR